MSKWIDKTDSFIQPGTMFIFPKFRFECPKCGTVIKEKKKFCPDCGTDMEMTDEEIKTWYDEDDDEE